MDKTVTFGSAISRTVTNLVESSKNYLCLVEDGSGKNAQKRFL